MTSVVLGPWACQLLADMGADVVKIEQPRGDSNRSLGAATNPGMAALYLTCNRNKRSIVLDLRQPGARDALLALVKDADVFVHNNRPQVMTKLGLDYSDMKKVNPRIIYCGAYGYSKHGPYGTLGALDDSIQAVSGVAALNEMVLGEPRYLPTVVADMVRFQRATGCRPGEVCIVRPCDVDTTGDVWSYRPQSHKTEHHGRQRVILISAGGHRVAYRQDLDRADSCELARVRRRLRLVGSAKCERMLNVECRPFYRGRMN